MADAAALPAAAPAPIDPVTGEPIPSVNPGMGNPAGQPNDNLFVTYNPQGANNGMFAPAYIHGYAPSEQAVAAWNASKGGLTREMVTNDLLMPDAWTAPQQEQTRGGMTDNGNFPGDGVYGGSNIPRNLTLGHNAAGSIDPEALRALSHGSAYDVGARRDAIAARLLSNQQAQDAYNNRPQPQQLMRGDAVISDLPAYDAFHHAPWTDG